MNVWKAMTKPRFNIVLVVAILFHVGLLPFWLGRVSSADLNNSGVIIPQHTSLGFKDIEIDSVKGVGSVIVAFKVRIPKIDDKDYIMKVSGDEYMQYLTVETEAFRLLNEPPTSPSIPTLIFQIPSIANPFRTRSEHDLQKLGLDKEEAKWLHQAQRIGIQTFPLVPHTGFPDSTNVPELVRLMRSLITALGFAHGRNVMNCDVHRSNIAYDRTTGTAHFFDWNAAQIFHAGGVKLHQVDENAGILPPEAADDGVHVTVSGADVYAAGIVLNKLLCGHTVCTRTTKTAVRKQQQQLRDNDKQLGHAYELAAWMMTADPYARPSAAELLTHDVFKQL